MKMASWGKYGVVKIREGGRSGGRDEGFVAEVAGGRLFGKRRLCDVRVSVRVGLAGMVVAKEVGGRHLWANRPE